MSRGGQRTPAPLTSELDLGREAYAQNRWREALEHLGAADAEGGLGPRDLVRFAHSAYWTGSLDRYLGLLERAYAAFLDAGEEQEAALAALMLQWDYLAKPATSLATGWYRRAERILQPCPECAAHGYLAQARLWDALAGGEMETALREARRIAAVGERVGDADLQVLGLLRQGQVLVARGDPAAGLERIDEAVVAAISGELGTMATAVVYCGAIASCRELADWERIGQWSGAATRWCERQACTGFPGLCRIYTAELTSLRGEWDRAEEELQRGAEELRRFGAPGMAAAGFYELGEIRRRLGDLAAARSAYTQAYELGLEPQPGLALLWLAEDDASAASAAIAGALQGTDGAAAGAEPSPGAGRLRRARLLAAQVEIELAAGDSATAAAAASELEAIAAA